MKSIATFFQGAPQGRTLRSGLLTVLIVVMPSMLLAQQQGKLVRVTVHAKSLENTITKENPDRHVSIYLPPSYSQSGERRYPVIYMLHGIGDSDQAWTTDWNDGSSKSDGYTTIQGIMNQGIQSGRFGEMIVVMPDQKTNWFGSFYTNSSVTGNWADFTTKELVSFVDENYRTIKDPASRGISGHSMGGYGAIMLAMKHPDVFSVAYAMNSAIVDFSGDITIAAPAYAIIAKAKGFDDLLKTRDPIVMGAVTVSQAFSPNPNKPPFFCDLPFEPIDGKMLPNESGFRGWREHSPIRSVEKYRGNLMKLRGLRFDSGFDDEYKFIPINSRALSAELTNNGIDHVFEEYEGDHRNRLHGKNGRLTAIVMPYFWNLLKHSD